MSDKSNETQSAEDFLLGEFTKIWRVLKTADVELQAYKNAVEVILLADPTWRESLDACLVAARQNDALLTKIEGKYDEILETSLRRLPENLQLKVRKQMVDRSMLLP
jgi:hypothetical protein